MIYSSNNHYYTGECVRIFTKRRADTTPTIAGSRSGGLIAQCWASMIAIGEEGYLKHTKDILETTVAIAKGVAGIPGLRLLGEYMNFLTFTNSKTL